MINFLDDTLLVNGYDCVGTRLFPLYQSAKFLILLVQVAVPFGLIIWGSLDWFKALIAHDEKEMRMKRKPFVARVIAALIVLCLPWLIELLSRYMAGKDNTSNFWKCYHQAKPVIDFSEWQNGPKSKGKFSYNGKKCEEYIDVAPSTCAEHGCATSKCNGAQCTCRTKCSSITAPVSSESSATAFCAEYSCGLGAKVDNGYKCRDKTSIDSNVLNKTKKSCADYSASKCPNGGLAENGEVCTIKKVKKKVKTTKNGKTKTTTKTTKTCVKNTKYGPEEKKQ